MIATMKCTEWKLWVLSLLLKGVKEEEEEKKKYNKNKIVSERREESSFHRDVIAFNI